MASDTPNVVVTSHYERLVQVRPYETERAGITVSETFSGELDAETIAQVANAQFLSAKSQVLTQLGLDFEHDDETSVIREIREVFPTAEVVEKKAPAKAIDKPAGKLAGRKPAALKVVESEPEEEEDDTEEEEAPKPAPKRKVAKAVEEPWKKNDIRAWQDLVDNPDDWEEVDNSSNTKLPDFRHLTKKDGTYKYSLWLSNLPKSMAHHFE